MSDETGAPRCAKCGYPVTRSWGGYGHAAGYQGRRHVVTVAAGPVQVMDVTTEAAAVRQQITERTAARRADESAARLARYTRGQTGYRLLG